MRCRRNDAAGGSVVATTLAQAESPRFDLPGDNQFRRIREACPDAPRLHQFRESLRVSTDPMGDVRSPTPSHSRGRVALRIALVAPPFLPIPPERYGGTERVIGVLADHLDRRGHDVTLFAAGDSTAPGRLVPTVPQSVWASSGWLRDAAPLMNEILEMVADRQSEFDIIHSHVERYGFDLARTARVPVVSTLHGRIDIGPTAARLPDFPDIPLVAISDRQRSFWPASNWVATIHHGVAVDSAPAGEGRGGYLLFVGRLTTEKGVSESIEVASRAGMPLTIAAKANEPHEVEIYEQIVVPAERAGVVRFVGEVGPEVRDRLFGDAYATLMLGTWPEPFGLVTTESLVTGTPLIARRAGALPEIVREGIDGFLVDDVDGALEALARVATLDRKRIRADTLVRFSPEKMIDRYEDLYYRLVESGKGGKADQDPQRNRAAFAARH